MSDKRDNSVILDKITAGVYTLWRNPRYTRPSSCTGTEEYTSALLANNEIAKELCAQFEADLIAHFGLTGHSKANKVYELARELGNFRVGDESTDQQQYQHEIVLAMQELVDLMGVLR